MQTNLRLSFFAEYIQFDIVLLLRYRYTIVSIVHINALITECSNSISGEALKFALTPLQVFHILFCFLEYFFIKISHFLGILNECKYAHP